MNRNGLLPVALALGLSACNPAATVDSLPEARGLAQRFFDDFEPGRFERTQPLFSELFFQTMPQETWAKVLPNVYEELGAIEDCELESWNQTTRVNTSDSGNFVTLVYACQHTKYESAITFVALKPLTGGESRIVSLNFNSLGLLLE